MSADIYCKSLIERLARHELLWLRGYQFLLAPKGGVLIERRGHARGIWKHDGERFNWTPMGYTEPTHFADDVAAAVRYTLVVLSAG
ncbi:MAG: hypothetical protein JNM89_16690 [Hyphomicrobiaceae bacterium]|nr:hypothetical protein [Hyphomicrobiaceae bacterium]